MKPFSAALMELPRPICGYHNNNSLFGLEAIESCPKRFATILTKAIQVRRKFGRSSGATVSEVFVRSSSPSVKNFFAWFLRGASWRKSGVLECLWGAEVLRINSYRIVGPQMTSCAGEDFKV